MFSICEATRWNHLPVAGGLYDQHPRLIEEWLVIFQAKAEHERRKQEAQKRKQASKKPGRSGGRRRR